MMRRYLMLKHSFQPNWVLYCKKKEAELTGCRKINKYDFYGQLYADDPKQFKFGIGDISHIKPIQKFAKDKIETHELGPRFLSQYEVVRWISGQVIKELSFMKNLVDFSLHLKRLNVVLRTYTLMCPRIYRHYSIISENCS